jgi:hypothetical protein
MCLAMRSWNSAEVAFSVAFEHHGSYSTRCGNIISSCRDAVLKSFSSWLQQFDGINNIEADQLEVVAWHRVEVLLAQDSPFRRMVLWECAH